MKAHKISWLNIPGYIPETWNPIIGCSKVSPGCENCYAEKMAHRLMHMPFTDYYQLALADNGEDDPEKFRNLPEWNGETHLVKSQLTKPANWKKPRAIFVCSMGDLFHENSDFENINAVFSVMSDCDEHIYILLTKRPEGAKRFFQWKSLQHGIEWKPKPNIWLGVTAENQEQANKRIPILLDIPAAKRFVSIEPMLGRVWLGQFKHENKDLGWQGKKGGYPYLNALTGEEYSVLLSKQTNHKLDWVIVGGETGHKARPMHPDWVRSVRDQCAAAGTPFFFKQWGEWLSKDQMKPLPRTTLSSDKWHSISPEGDHGLLCETSYMKDELIYKTIGKVGRKTAGDLLYGKQYHAWPIQSVNPSIPQS